MLRFFDFLICWNLCPRFPKSYFPFTVSLLHLQGFSEVFMPTKTSYHFKTHHCWLKISSRRIGCPVGWFLKFRLREFLLTPFFSLFRWQLCNSNRSHKGQYLPSTSLFKIRFQTLQPFIPFVSFDNASLLPPLLAQSHRWLTAIDVSRW